MLVTATIFQPLVDVFEAVLKFFHNSIGVPWGWSIVVLTIVVRAILLPLTVKQFHSMQKMQRLTPEMKRLQAKYKQDKQRQQQELMKLYQEHGVNPFGSCLPLVAQLPVFIGLYYMLRTSLRGDICPQIQPGYSHALHKVVSTAHTVPCGTGSPPHGGAGFLFIPDLTNKATGAVLVVLLLLYVGTQLASSLMMSTPQMDKNQRRLMLLLPLVFVFIVIGFPSGVLVYWITTNMWTMGQQYFIRRRLGPMTPITATADGDAAAGKGVPAKAEPSAAPNGASTGGVLGGLLRGLTKNEEQREKVTTAQRTGPRTTAPPPPPRKKKKRSGRRR
jgi:YidC/Oxa1 family membrane protein insertase